MHLFNQLFDRVVCISLVESPQRYEHMKQQMESASIEAEFHRVVIHPFNEQIARDLTGKGVASFGSSARINEFGRAREHYAVIKKAKLDGCKSILILEDDIVVSDPQAIETYVKSLPEDWSLVLFGASSAAYALSADAMDFYLECQNKKYSAAHAPLIAMQNVAKFKCCTPEKSLMVRERALGSTISTRPMKMPGSEFFRNWKMPIRKKWWKRILNMK